MELWYPHRVLASYLMARENLINYGVSHAGNRMFGFQEPLETHAFTKPWVTGPNNTDVVFGTKELFHESLAQIVENADGEIDFPRAKSLTRVL